jgi:hypothetical protein
MITTRRVARRTIRRPHRAIRRGSRTAARRRRTAYPAIRLRSILAALRALWLKTGRTLTSGFTARAIAGLAGVVRLVIDCFALHAVLIA